ncbi:MAG: DUF3536 domain-containing protein [Deltaproteobacteria bacterium]|nr:MAG: DUF3536 domain-containing protein [Deltaproteobacteria bacterium]
MTRFVCIHAHFYQPPRTNPWTGRVYAEPSARPFHDWNERILRECYEPNASARILDGAGNVRRLLNNYSYMSFNFGPTLIGWIESHSPSTYSAIVEADRISRSRFGGHGSAIAQAYSHAILPLCTPRDLRTQISWGLADFEHRFGRPAEAIWLPECAADMKTLEAIAQAGMRFVILAPRQAARVRPLDGTEWVDVDAETLDTTEAYLCELPSKRKLAVFFYDGRLSQQVAFEGLLENGDRLADLLMQRAGEEGLASIATDGETYGHHHKFGEMALAYAIDKMEHTGGVRLTNFAEFLERHPPRKAVELKLPSSWSCVHGIERWRSDCGCSSGAHPGWNQRWREPLRRAIDELAGFLAEQYELATCDLFHDPWKARDDYIRVLLAPQGSEWEQFLHRNARRAIGEGERAVAFEMLRAHYHGQLMQASCGWFFDDISGIEAGIVMLQAARAMELVRSAIGHDFEPRFVEILAEARSNLPRRGTGADIYRRILKERNPGVFAEAYEEAGDAADD